MLVVIVVGAVDYVEKRLAATFFNAFSMLKKLLKLLVRFPQFPQAVERKKFSTLVFPLFNR
jgi:hypothetical protein